MHDSAFVQDEPNGQGPTEMQDVIKVGDENYLRESFVQDQLDTLHGQVERQLDQLDYNRKAHALSEAVKSFEEVENFDPDDVVEAAEKYLNFMRKENPNNPLTQ